MTDQLTPDESESLVRIDHYGLASKALRILDEQAATLERVRAVLPKNHSSLIPSMLVAEAIGGRFEGGEWVWIYPTLPFGSSAKEDWCPNCGCGNNKAGFAHLEGCHLADQPEAPVQTRAYHRDVSQPDTPKNPFICDADCESPRCPVKVWEREQDQHAAPKARSGECPDKTTCAECADGPEAPKAGPLPVREHARRRGSLDGADAQALEGALSQVERDLAAANAKIAELETEAKAWKEDRHEMANALHRTSIRLTAANARADAAERSLVTMAEANESLARTTNAAERDAAQLAARVKELELELEHARQIVGGQPCEHEANQCTPEERNVLDACKQSEIHPGTPGISDPCINRGEWRIAAAELANRAAKAKRGGA